MFILPIYSRLGAEEAGDSETTMGTNIKPQHKLLFVQAKEEKWGRGRLPRQKFYTITALFQPNLRKKPLVILILTLVKVEEKPKLPHSSAYNRAPQPFH